jgi:hypothetical protein
MEVTEQTQVKRVTAHACVRGYLPAGIPVIPFGKKIVQRRFFAAKNK